jgi:hypothetical protein
MKMPEKLKEFLSGKPVQLSKKEADEVWAYFANSRHALEDMIEEVVNSCDLMDYWKETREEEKRKLQT